MRIRFAPEAFVQIAEICAYISQENPSAARKARQRIGYVAALLADNPEMGKVISDDEVLIVSVYHGARRRPAFHEPAIEFQL